VKNKRLYREALRIIGRRDFSEEEIREKLVSSFPPSEVEILIEDFRGKGYLNDLTMAERISERLLNRHKGYYYIFSELKRRKIREDVLADMDNSFDYEREFVKAREFFGKNLGKKKPSSVFFSLRGRGFSSGTMERVASHYMDITKGRPIKWKADR